MNPKVLLGMFVGAMMSFLFCGLTMNAVGRAANQMVNEVRRQFRENLGIMKGTSEPDYARCVSISTKAAQKEMLFPSLLAVIAPVVTGLLLGVSGVLGLLGGSLALGLVLAVFMANSGGAWDNAKKYIEQGNFGGKGSDAHKAAVIGDTVGRPVQGYVRALAQHSHKAHEHGGDSHGRIHRIVFPALKFGECFLARGCVKKAF